MSVKNKIKRREQRERARVRELIGLSLELAPAVGPVVVGGICRWSRGRVRGAVQFDHRTASRGLLDAFNIKYCERNISRNGNRFAGWRLIIDAADRDKLRSALLARGYRFKYV